MWLLPFLQSRLTRALVILFLSTAQIEAKQTGIGSEQERHDLLFHVQVLAGNDKRPIPGAEVHVELLGYLRDDLPPERVFSSSTDHAGECELELPSWTGSARIKVIAMVDGMERTAMKGMLTLAGMQGRHRYEVAIPTDDFRWIGAVTRNQSEYPNPYEIEGRFMHETRNDWFVYGPLGVMVDDSNRFSFRGPSGTMRLDLRAEGRLHTFEGICRPGGGEIRMALPAEYRRARISIKEPDGSPVKQARIRFGHERQSMGSPSQDNWIRIFKFPIVYEVEDGELTIEDLPRTGMDMKIETEGVVQWSGYFGPLEDRVEIRIDDKAERQVHGFVSDDRQSPLPQAEVKYLPLVRARTNPTHVEHHSWTKSEVDEFARFRCTMPSQALAAMVCARAPGFAPSCHVLEKSDNGSWDRLTLTLSKERVLKGQVVTKDGRPAVGFRVHAVGGSKLDPEYLERGGFKSVDEIATWVRCFTDKSGRFEFTGMSPSEYQLIVRKPRGGVVAKMAAPYADQEFRIEIGDGMEDRVRLVLEALDGRNSHPLKGFKVQVVTNGGSRGSTYSTEDASNGIWKANLTPGRMAFAVLADGYARWSSREMDCQPGELRLAARLLPAVHVLLHIEQEDGSPAAGITTKLEDRHGTWTWDEFFTGPNLPLWRWPRTDQHGFVEFREAPAGQMKLMLFNREGELLLRKDVNLSNAIGGRYETRITLEDS